MLMHLAVAWRGVVRVCDQHGVFRCCDLQVLFDAPTTTPLLNAVRQAAMRCPRSLHLVSIMGDENSIVYQTCVLQDPDRRIMSRFSDRY